MYLQVQVLSAQHDIINKAELSVAFNVVFIVLNVFVILYCVHMADLSVACHVVTVSTGHRLPELSGWAVSVMSCHVILLCTQDTDSQNCLAQLSVSCHVIIIVYTGHRVPELFV